MKETELFVEKMPKIKPMITKRMLITVYDIERNNKMYTNVVKPFNIRYQKTGDKVRLMFDKGVPQQWLDSVNTNNFSIAARAGDDPKAIEACDCSSLGYFRFMWLLKHCKLIKNENNIIVVEGLYYNLIVHYGAPMR